MTDYPNKKVLINNLLSGIGAFLCISCLAFLNLSESADLREAAFNLFNFLRKLDKLNKKQISIYPIPKKGIGKVINERLNRANSK